MGETEIKNDLKALQTTVWNLKIHSENHDDISCKTWIGLRSIHLIYSEKQQLQVLDELT